MSLFYIYIYFFVEEILKCCAKFFKTRTLFSEKRKIITENEKNFAFVIVENNISPSGKAMCIYIYIYKTQGIRRA